MASASSSECCGPMVDACDAAAALRAVLGDKASALADAGISKATVALATADPGQYTELMRPEGGDHSTVCGFIASLAEAGVEVEATAVERPGVDVAAARKLAGALGAGFRTRTYHP